MVDIYPVPGANGDVKNALKNLCDSIPEDTVVCCPYVESIFDQGKPSKTYSKPVMEVLEVDTGVLLAASGHHGRENACDHGANKWFCDDFDDED